MEEKNIRLLKILFEDGEIIKHECKYLKQSTVTGVTFTGFYSKRELKVNFLVNGSYYLVTYFCKTKRLYLIFTKYLRRLSEY